MVNTGQTIVINPARHYEDMASLKKFIRSNTGNRSYATDSVYEYVSNTMREHIIAIDQTTTGTEAEFESGAGTPAIAQIGSTAATLVLSASGDNAGSNGITFTAVYYSRDGVSHTATATGTATLNGTPVAFSPAITDFYSMVSFTASSAPTVVNVTANVNAGATYATISADAAAATQAQLFGIGTVYIKGSADHTDADNKVGYACYMTPWGALKYMIGTLGADSDEEVIFYEATDDGDGTTTVVVGNYQVKDFWYLLWWNMSAAATGNAYFTIGDADHNSNGGGGDVYAAITNGYTTSINTRIRAPYGWHTWLAKVRVHTHQGDGNDSYLFKAYYTPAALFAMVDPYTLADGAHDLEIEKPVLLKEGTDAYFTISDVDAACTATFEVIALMVQYNV
jgi:hypothetical protein